MSDVISPITPSGLTGKGGKKGKNKSNQRQSNAQAQQQQQQQDPPQQSSQQENPENDAERQPTEDKSPEHEQAVIPAAAAEASESDKSLTETIVDAMESTGITELSTPWPAKEQRNGPDEFELSSGDSQPESDERTEDSEESATGDNAQPARTTAEELVALTQEKDALEKQRLKDKDIRELNKLISECRNNAKGIKGDVLKVLQERRSCEEECLEIERNIGEKLSTLTVEVHKSTKECMEGTIEEVEPETRTPIPLGVGSSVGAVGGREKRANSKSATPPPTGASGQDKDRALQERIYDLSKQEPAKKLSASSKKKAVESVLRSLGDFETTEEKLRALCELHYETLEQLRETQSTTDRWRKQFQTSQKENNRSLLARDRLEGLCRELQKHNNAIKEESALRRREEEEKRKHIAAKFQATLTDISTLMADTQETSAKLRQDNAQLASKLRTLVNHYDIWEKHAENMLKQKTIEAELAMAKLREAQLLREKDVTEVEHSRKLLETATKEMQTQLEASLRNEILLRQQLKLHNDKYEEFQEAIVSSNKMFTDFKGEVESMGKQTRKYEKEALQWKQRWEEANLATARVFQEKTKSDLKVETLSRLCRSLREKLRITNQDMAELESSVAGEVVTEEKAKLEEELSRKQREIEQHKHALEVRQREVQSKLLESSDVADKAAKDLEQALTSVAEVSTPPAAAADVPGLDVEVEAEAPSEDGQETTQPTASSSSSSKKEHNKKKNKKKH